jgi:2-methylaconitate cis-trans-isomerase PrpF
MRGGTSKAIVFHARDLPLERALWDEIFLSAIGSPDPYGRQLDGMGGGVSSLSKVCVVGPSTVAAADIDFTFAQILIREGRVDYSSNCGNMISAMGPFAVDEALLPAACGEMLVRIHNTNTRKIIHARFSVDEGSAAVEGDSQIPGVAGTGAPVRLEFLNPGGATTGKLLPTGRVRDTLQVPGVGAVEMSMVDAANACVFVRARDVGLTGAELPDALEANREVMTKLEAIRLSASGAMGIAANEAEAKGKLSNPAIGVIAAPTDAPTLSGAQVRASDVDLTARMLAKGQAHRALPLTRTLCMAAAARIEGTLVHEAARAPADPDGVFRIGMPSGIMTAAARVRRRDGTWDVEQGAFFRTQRRLFEGHVLVRTARTSAQTSVKRTLDDLEIERLRLQTAINAYPAPIPGCDVYFNDLLAQRSRISEEINAIRTSAANC